MDVYSHTGHLAPVCEALSTCCRAQTPQIWPWQTSWFISLCSCSWVCMVMNWTQCKFRRGLRSFIHMLAWSGCVFVSFIIFQLLVLTVIVAVLTSLNLSAFERWRKCCRATTDVSSTGTAGVLWLIHSQLNSEVKVFIKMYQSKCSHMLFPANSLTFKTKNADDADFYFYFCFRHKEGQLIFFIFIALSVLYFVINSNFQFHPGSSYYIKCSKTICSRVLLFLERKCLD